MIRASVSRRSAQLEQALSRRARLLAEAELARTRSRGGAFWRSAKALWPLFTQD